MISFLEDDWENLHDLEFGGNILDMTPKAWPMRKTLDKLDLIKI
jgi:hypothetical protein